MEFGRFQQQCPSKRVFEPATGTRLCFCCGQLGHLKRIVRCREMTRGRPGRATGFPAIIGPDTNTLITVAAMRRNAVVVTGLLGGVAMEKMLDSGYSVRISSKEGHDVITNEQCYTDSTPCCKVGDSSR